MEVDQGELAQDLGQHSASGQVGRSHQDADYRRGKEEPGADEDVADSEARGT